MSVALSSQIHLLRPFSSIVASYSSIHDGDPLHRDETSTVEPTLLKLRDV